MDKETQQNTTSSTTGTTNNRHSASKNSTRNRQQSGSNAQSKRRLHGDQRIKSPMAVSSDASSNSKKQSSSDTNPGTSDGGNKDIISRDETPSPAAATSNGSGGNSASGRRERKQKFDVKKLLNIRGNTHGVAVTAAATAETAKAAAAATAGGGAAKKNRKSEGDGMTSTSPSPSPSPSPATMNHKTRRSGRVAAAAAAAKTTSPSAAAATTNGEADAPPMQQQKVTATHVVCNDPHLKDSEHSIVLTGKRERKRKRFWDDEQAEAEAANAPVTNTSPAPTPSKQARKVDGNKSSGGGGGGGGASSINSSSGTGSGGSSSGKSSKAPVSAASAAASDPQSKSKRRDRRSSGLDSVAQQRQQKGGGDESKENSATSLSSSSSAPASTSATPVKLNGKSSASALGYLQFDFSLEPAMIAKQMVEGVNIPGPGVPIPVDSTNLPEGWEKRVIQRGIGITKGKWDVFIQSPAGKSFRSKIELQRFFEEKSLPFSSEAFDFSLDDHLKKLRQIWKQHIVIPQQKAAAAAAAAAALAAAQDISGSLESAAVSPAKSVSSSSPPSAAASTAPLATATGDKDGRRPSSPLTEDGHGGNGSDPLGTESETGQGLRCSIAGCRKLFRNDRLLHMHVKHYHPEVFGSLVQQSGALSVEDLAANRTSLVDELVAGDGAETAATASSSSPPSPATASSSRKSSQEDGASNSNRKRKLSQGEKARVRNGSGPGMGRSGGGGSSNKRRASQSVDPDHRVGPEVFNSHTRSRNDSILSVGSESSTPAAAAAAEDSVFQPSTPPTFRMSKRRQAQLKKKKKLGGSGSGTSSPLKGRNKEDSRFMEEYMTFIGGNQELPPFTAPAATASSLPTTPAATARAASPGSGGGAAATTEPTSSAPPSYPPSEMDASVASEHLTSEEVVNCTCKRTEEDGLMIQCDICLCWQHGNCLGIDEEDQVPDKHVCSICKEPKAGRTEQRFSIDQDWLKEGKLQTVALGDHNYCASASAAFSEREGAFRKLSELMADLANLSRVLHSLRIKLFVASQSNHGKVFMWSSPWNDDHAVEQGAVVKKEPVEEEMPLGTAANDLQRAKGDLLGAHAISAAVGEAAVSPGLIGGGRIETGGDGDGGDGSEDRVATAEAKAGGGGEASRVPPQQQREQNSTLSDKTTTTPPPPPQCASPTPALASVTGAAASSPAELRGQAETSFPPTPSAGAGDAEVDDAHLLNGGGGDEVNGATPNATFAAVKDEVFSESGSNNITPPKVQPQQKEQQQQGAGTATAASGPLRSGKAADTPNSLSPKSNKDEDEDGSASEIKDKRANGFDDSPPPPLPSEKLLTVNERPQEGLRDSAAPVAALTPPDENDLDTTGTTVTEEDAEVAAAAVAAHEAAMTVDENIQIDPSMIPSVSEVQQLLPSIIQAIQQEDGQVATAAVDTGQPPPSQPLEPPMPETSAFVPSPTVARTPLPIIPEQKRIDKDECRLNLLEHIEKMQNEVDTLLGKVEVNLSAVERSRPESISQASFSSPSWSSSAATPTAAALDKMSARTKALAMALIHDVSTARKLVGAL